MPETIPDESICAQKIVTYIKGRDLVTYTTAYDAQQAWDAYLDCFKRFGPTAAAKVGDTPAVSREMSKKAWEELQEFKSKPAKPKEKKEKK